jgi:hypothetical protein
MRRITLFLIALMASALPAQEERRVPCPSPYRQVFTNGATPTPIAAEFPANLQAGIAGSVWNQTVVHKHFGHTFTFPSQRECCVMTKGTLSVTIKALEGGGPNSSTSTNDAVHAIGNRAIFQSQQPWLNTTITTGATATVTFQIPPAVLASGNVSVYVQDDSAVVAAKLEVSGCCLRKP